MNQFIWESFNHPQLSKLRTKYNLDEVISQGKNEFENQLLLKDWIHKTLPFGFPKEDYSSKSAFEILEDAALGKPMHCTQYAFALLQCSTALGWYARKLSIDSDHEEEEEEMHHGIIDIWSKQLQKWYVIDGMNNLHYEKDGIPLNSLEIRFEYLKNEGKDLKGIIGNNKEELEYSSDSKGFNTPSNYFWFFIALRNNFFEKPGLYDTKALLWIDESNENKIWYKGGGKKGESYKHPMYESQFIKTSNINEAFPQM